MAKEKSQIEITVKAKSLNWKQIHPKPGKESEKLAPLQVYVTFGAKWQGEIDDAVNQCHTMKRKNIDGESSPQ